MNIIVTMKSKWGKDLFYPESDDAVFLTEFTGRPTLLKQQLKLALDRGWNVKIKHERIDLKEYLENHPTK